MAMGHRSLPQSDAWSPSLNAVNGGPGLGQQRPRLLPFPGGTKVEPEALWLETKIDFNEEGDRLGGGPPRSGKLSGPGLGMGESLDQEGQGLPQPSRSAKGLGRQFWWEGGRALPRRQGEPCCGGGYGPSCHATGGGAGPIQVGKDEGSPASRPLLWWESLWWDGHRPLAPVLLALGDERLSLPRLRMGAWVTEAALYPLGAGAVTRRRAEDVVGAWGRGLLGPHHDAPVVLMVLLGHPFWIPAQPQDLALQLLVHQVHRLGRLRGGWVDGDRRQVGLWLIGQRVWGRRARHKLASVPEPCPACAPPQPVPATPTEPQQSWRASNHSTGAFPSPCQHSRLLFFPSDGGLRGRTVFPSSALGLP